MSAKNGELSVLLYTEVRSDSESYLPLLGAALPRPLPEGLPVVDGQLPPLPGFDDEGRPAPPLPPLP